VRPVSPSHRSARALVTEAVDRVNYAPELLALLDAFERGDDLNGPVGALVLVVLADELERLLELEADELVRAAYLGRGER